MTNEEAKKLLDRYLKGECTPEEEARLDAWLEKMAGNGTLQWSAEERGLTGDEIKQAIDTRIGGQKTRVVRFRTVLAAASAIILCVVAVYAIRLPYNRKTEQLAYKETVVPPGEKIRLVLSDSSVVVLNGSSRVRYPEQFGSDVRQVELLEGEAYFDIQKDGSRPFIVQAARTKITVLGTAFNVRAYPFLKNVQVTVTKGKVAVDDEAGVAGKKQQPIILTPDEQVTIAATVNTNSAIKKHIHSDQFVGWVQGKYVFDNETLGNVAQMLESYFNVHIAFTNDTLKDIRFSSEFDTTDKLKDLVFAICKANNLTCRINGQQILFSGKR